MHWLWDSAACRITFSEVPRKTYREDVASLVLSTSSINTTFVTTDRAASMAQSFPHSGREAGREDILPRDEAFCGAMLAP